MKYCDLTLPSPEENLACDEALLDLCDEGAGDEVLRFWEPAQYFVVVGYANQAATEANVPFCRKAGIPVFRRCSGGGTVLQGPGCLNYSLILRVTDTGPLQNITTANRYIMQRHQTALSALLRAQVDLKGHTDLAIGGLKFSGNAQRRKRRALLFHGAFLLDFDIRLIERTLLMPSKQPDYRANRSHTEFLKNIRVPAREVKSALCRAWQATENTDAPPSERIQALARTRYATAEWNLKF